MISKKKVKQLETMKVISLISNLIWLKLQTIYKKKAKLLTINKVK